MTDVLLDNAFRCKLWLYCCVSIDAVSHSMSRKCLSIGTKLTRAVSMLEVSTATGEQARPCGFKNKVGSKI